MDTVASGGLAAKSTSNDAELVLVDEVRDAGEPYTSYLRWSIEKVRGNVLEAKEFPEVLTAYEIQLT